MTLRDPCPLLLPAVLALAFYLDWLVKHLPPPPPPVVDQPAVLRRLEIRLHADLDKTHPVVGGERYRVFECREVPRKRPVAGEETP